MGLEPRLLIRHSAAPAAVALDLLLSWDKSSLPAIGGPVLLLVLTGLVALPLSWRHAAPVATLIAVLCGTVTVAVIVPGFVPVFATWIALFAVSVRCSRTVAAAGLLASLITLAVNAATEALVRAGASGSGPESLATAVAAGLLVHGGLFGLGRWVKWSIEQRRLVAALAAREAAASERSRIARDLHDIVAHSVSLMVIHAGAAGKAMATRPDRAAESMQHITELGERAVGELRQMLGLLQGGQLQEKALPEEPRTSVASTRTLVSDAALAGLAIDFSVHGSPVRLSREADEACYRIIQEAVTNALKHGSGGSARLALRWQSDGVSFELLNQAGQPGAAAGLSTGRGLAGMAARAATAGGFLEAGGSADGFRVHARFPGKVPAQPPVPSH